MIASFRSEWLRLRKRPAVWILALTLVAIVLLLSYLLVWILFTYPPRGFSTPGTTPALLKRTLYPGAWLHSVMASSTGLGGAIALILGVLAAGSEYGWSTVKTMVTQRPGRLAVLAGKGLALALLLGIMTLAVLAGAAAASAILVTVDGATSAWPAAGEVLKAFAAAWLVLGLHAGLGFVLAMLFRQSALAVGLGLVYVLVIEGLVLGLLGGADAFRPVVSAFPGPNAGALEAAFPTPVAAAGRVLVGPGQAALVVAAYTVLFAAVSGLFFRTRDIA